MTMSGDDAMSRAGRVSARHIEVFTGGWSSPRLERRPESRDRGRELCGRCERQRGCTPAWAHAVAVVHVAAERAPASRLGRQSRHGFRCPCHC